MKRRCEMVTTNLNLSMNNPEVVQIHAKQGDSGRLYKINLKDATEENGTLRILRPDGVEVTADAIKSAGGDAYKGDLVTFDALEEVPLTKCEVTLESTQDLHGYDYPWPSGGGKNKYSILVGDDSFVNNGSATHSSSDGALVIVTNASSGSSGVYLASGAKVLDAIDACDAPLTFSCDVVATASGSVRFTFCGTQNLVTVGTTKQRVSVTATSKSTRNLSIYGVNNGATVTVSNVQIESGSTATSYAPYSNICPISGRDEVTVYDDAKYGGLVNFNQLIQNGDFANGTTSWSASGSNTISASGGELSVSIGGAWNNDARQTLNTVADHKYIVLFEAKGDSTITKVNFGQFGLSTNASIGIVTLSTEYQSFAKMMTVAENATTVRFSFGENGTSYVGKKYYLKNVNLFDLTAMFGSGNEPTVAQFRTLFSKDYYAYNVGTEMMVGEVNGEPYRKIAISLGQPVYGGTLDVVSGKLTIEWISAIYSSANGFSTYSAYCNAPNNVAIVKATSAIKSSYLKTYNGNTNTSSMPDYSITNMGGSNYIFGLRLDSTYTSKAEYDAYLSANPLQVILKLATPTEVDLTPTQITTLLGTNNIWSSGEVEVAFEYDGLFAQLPEEATEVVGRCLGDVNFTNVSTMPFTLNVIPNNQEETP